MFPLSGSVVVSCCQASHPELESATLTSDGHSMIEISSVVRKEGKVRLAGKKLEAERKAGPLPRLRQEWEARIPGNPRGL